MTPTPDKPAGEALRACPFCGCKTVRDFKPFERNFHRIDCNLCNRRVG